MSLPGLRNYRHDSEISDSEGESSPNHTTHMASGIMSSGLGIPSSRSKKINTPPTMVLSTIQSAPVISLVGYDSEDVINTSTDILNEVFNQPLPMVNDAMQSVEEDIQSGGSSFFNSEPLFLSVNEIELPPEDSGSCSLALQEKIRTHLRKKCQLGVSPYDVIIKGKSFKNPSISEKLMQLCGIDELGTNWDKNMFNPKEWEKEEFYEKLAEAQRKAHENKMKSRGKIEFKSGTKVPPATVKAVEPGGGPGGAGLLPIPTATVQDTSKKRKSKWDNPLQEQKNSCGTSPISTTSSAGVGAQALVNARLIDKNLMKLFKS